MKTITQGIQEHREKKFNHQKLLQTKKPSNSLFQMLYKIPIIPLIKKLNHSRLPQIYNNEKLNFVVFPGISQRLVEKTDGYRK